MASPKILEFIVRANSQIAAAKQAIEQVGTQLPNALRKAVASANAATAGLRRMGEQLIQTRKQQAAAASELTANNGYIQSATRVAAALFSVQQLRRYITEAEEARKVQAQLAFALRQTGQYTESYIANLEAMATTLERATGTNREMVLSIERLLVQAGIGPDLIGQMTEAVLDMSAAMELGPTEAGKQMANVLNGTQNTFGEYAINLEGAVTRTQRAQRILETLAARGITGQARTGFSGQVQGVVQFRIELENATKSLGDFLARMAGPVLAGFNDGLRKSLDLVRSLLIGNCFSEGPRMGASKGG